MSEKPAHRDLLAEYVIPLNTPERREAYRSGEFARAEKVQDLNRRYRWDLLWIAQASRGATGEGPLSPVLDPEASVALTYQVKEGAPRASGGESHIDAVLRLAVPCSPRKRG